MKHIAIISASVRDGRLSHRVALFLEQYIREQGLASTEVLDLKAYNFPLFNERIIYQQNPSKEVLDFTERFKKADGILIVSPVYNSDYSAALKNVIDLYYAEWQHKPVAVTSVTMTPTPGIATIQKLQTLLLKLGAWVAPAFHTVTNAETAFDPEGNPAEKASAEKRARPQVEELLAIIERMHH